MFNPAGMRAGRPATGDLHSSTRTNPETTMVSVIAGYSDSVRDMRLRLQFDDRELVVDQRTSSIAIGRAEENDVVVKGRLSSRLHARIVIGRRNFVLIDQSTNGTFVQTGDGEQFFTPAKRSTDAQYAGPVMGMQLHRCVQVQCFVGSKARFGRDGDAAARGNERS